MTARIYTLRPARPAVSLACRWHETIERVTEGNLRVFCAWQRMILRAWWRL